MQPPFKPRLDILPDAQRAMWDALAPSFDLNFVLYGGTAVALRLGHRTSLDFDFFRDGALDKDQIRDRFSFMRSAKIVQDALNTLVASTGQTQVSFFGNIRLAA
jgi:nucleotidyltransferase AbiEii toxin of type IV toxin-antitoxin system